MKRVRLLAGTAALLLANAIPARPQTLSVVYSFSAATYAQETNTDDAWGFTNIDGAQPFCGLTLSNDTLYGTTEVGGAGSGTIFSVRTDGTGYNVLHTFVDSAGSCPYAGLLLSGTALYGTTTGGGGVVFSINTDGSGFTVLHSGAASSMAELAGAGSTLYGTTEDDVFAINMDGTGYAELHSFSEADYNSALKLYTNWDGADSWGSVVVSSNVLYGTASYAGPYGCGTIFSVNTNGSGYTVLKGFAGGADGATPLGGLTLAGNVLYGTTSLGGTNGQGTIFSIHTDGSGYTVLHNFGGAQDGENPRKNLLFHRRAGMLYGTTLNGGAGAGTVFGIGTNGTGYSVLRALDFNADGGNPAGGVVMGGNTIYGTASGGGTNGSGTVFSLSLPAPAIAGMSIQGANLIIRATNGMAGSNYTLLGSADSAVPLCQWTPIASGTFDTNGSSTLVLTNSVNSSAQQGFYALRVQ